MRGRGSSRALSVSARRRVRPSVAPALIFFIFWNGRKGASFWCRALSPCPHVPPSPPLLVFSCVFPICSESEFNCLEREKERETKNNGKKTKP